LGLSSQKIISDILLNAETTFIPLVALRALSKSDLFTRFGLKRANELVTSRDPPSRSSFKVVMTEEFERNISKGKKIIQIVSKHIFHSRIFT
jgi:hypothetical protein